jgi:hypothetical protein
MTARTGCGTRGRDAASDRVRRLGTLPMADASEGTTGGGATRFLRENGLSIALFGLFAVFAAGQAVAGWTVHNDDLREHGRAAWTFGRYLASGDFVEALFENWESEFLQMAAFAMFTMFLRQKGSSESKPLDGPTESDREPDATRDGAPWPVRRGGLVLAVYKHSLCYALFALFALSFVLHAFGGARAYNEEQLAHGGHQTVTTWSYMATSRFWFESLQNWQSEFLAVGALIVLSVFLRQKGSSQSKPVDAPHAETTG